MMIKYKIFQNSYNILQLTINLLFPQYWSLM